MRNMKQAGYGPAQTGHRPVGTVGPLVGGQNGGGGSGFSPPPPV